MNFVDVDERRIRSSSGLPNGWWACYRRNAYEAGRAQILRNDTVRLICDDQAHATWLATYLTTRIGLPKAAVIVSLETE